MANRIKGITVEIGGDTTKLTESLKSVDKQISNTQKSLRDVNKLLKLDPGNTELLSQKQKGLQTEIAATKERLEALKEAAKQADAALANGDMSQSQYDALQREIVETEQDLKSLTKEYENFGSVSAQKIAAAGEKVKSVGESLSSAGTKMTMGFTAPVVAGATAAVTAYGDVDKQFNLVKQTMGDTANSAEDFEGLWDQIGTSAKNSVYGMQDAADATLNFARQGFTAKEATDMLTPAMNLAAGTGTDLSETTSGLGNAMKMFGADSSEAANYADVLAKAQAQANTTTSELFEAMSVAGPICKTVGWDVKDLATITDVFGNAGISGSEGANALKTGLARLASPAKEGATAMDQLGLSTGQTYAIFNENGTLKDMPTVLANLNSAFSGLTDQEKLEAAANIFGKNQMSKWLTLIQTSPSEVSSLRDALDDCGGSAENMSNALMSGTGGTIEQLKSTFDVLTVTIGQAVAPAFQSLMEKIIDVMNAIMDMDPATQKMILTITAIVAAIGPVLIVVGKMATGVGALMTLAPKIVSAIGVVKTGITGLNAAMAANPIGLIITAIGLLVAAFIYLWNNCESFRNFWINLWDNIKEVAVTVWTAIKDFFVTIWSAISSVFTSAVNGISSFLSGAWNGIQSVVTTVMNAIGSVIQTVWNGIKTFFTTIFTAIQAVVTTYFNIYKTVITTVLTAIQTVVTTVWNAIKMAISTVCTAIQTVVTTVWNAIKTAITTVINGIKTAVTTAWNGIKTVTSTVFNGIKSVATSVWNGIKSAVMSVVNAMKSGITSAFNAIKSTISGILNGIKSTFSSVFNGIWSFVSGIVSKLKNVFNFHWELPKIKLPHFSVSGSFSLNPPSIPHFSVSWYKKAMDGGMILKDATIFGQSGGTLLGGGEAGDEAVVGVNSLRNMIKEAVSENAGNSGPLINIETMSVRSDDDIRKISQQLNTLLVGSRRAKGSVI
jgi:TP901 family phage tail tape measure protein